MGVQPLFVTMGPHYELRTPFLPGVPPESPLYTISTPVVPGIPPDNPPHYTLSTPLIPGGELALGAGPDDLDVTYLQTTLSPPSVTDHQDETFLPTRTSFDHGPWHLDETYEPTTLIITSATVDVSPITFFPLRRKSTVQALTTVLYPGLEQDVVFGSVRDV